MRVVVIRHNTPLREAGSSVSGPARLVRSCVVIVLSLILAVALLVPAWSPNDFLRAPSASADATNIDPNLMRELTVLPSQLWPVIVEMRPLAPPFPPAVNEVLAQRAVALLTQYGRAVGGIALINGAAGFANAAGVWAISLDPGVAYIYADLPVHPTASSSTQVPLSAAYPRSVNADRVWWQRSLNGVGTGVAVLDSGINPDPDITQPQNRLMAAANFAGDRGGMADVGGHGTHVAGIVGGNGYASNGEYIGIAPGANVVDVRVLNRNGHGRISSVVRGIEWVLAHRAQYNLRLINLSLGMTPSGSYRLNPLDAAVEIAWMRGVAVIAAAGNGGPASGTVESPGDDPYVITAGATDDKGTAGVNDDTLASFSAWGTPQDSTPKPELVAPGRRIVSLRVPGSYLDAHYPDRVTLAHSGATYFRLSGTSMATAVVTGAAALMLQQQPALKPDQVKSIAMGTAQTFGWDATSPPLPDPRADGSGLVDALAEATSSASATFNRHSFRPGNTFARSMYPVVYGAPLVWKDPNYLALPWSTFTWTSLSWDDLAWDNLSWDDLAWDSLAWNNVGWDDLAWDNVGWDDLAWDGNLSGSDLAWDSGQRD